MVRRVLSLALALQLMLPSFPLLSLLAAAAPAREAAPKAEAKVCPCNGKVGCKCCGCGDEDEPATEAAPVKPDANPGPHGCVHCRCNVAEALAAVGVYLPDRGPMWRTLCQPQQEWLSAPSERWLSATMPIDSPPPKNNS